MKKTKAQKIAKEMAKCKHGFGLTHRTCAYCRGYAVSNYPSSVGLAYIREKFFFSQMSLFSENLLENE